MTSSPGYVARAIVASKKAKQTSQSTAAEEIVADSTTENMADNETLSQRAPAATRTASENAKGKTISESGTDKTRDNGREKRRASASTKSTDKRSRKDEEPKSYEKSPERARRSLSVTKNVTDKRRSPRHQRPVPKYYNVRCSIEN
jgi:hypothetical protein